MIGKILRALQEFRNRTYEQYEQEHKKTRPAWMEKVMRIHEQSRFLFYYDESLEEEDKPFSMLVKGELVRGEGLAGPDSHLILYNGQGEFLGEGRPLTSPEDQEEERQGFLTPRRNAFRMEILSFQGYPARKMNHDQKEYSFQAFWTGLSLISDYRCPEDGGEKQGDEVGPDEGTGEK